MSTFRKEIIVTVDGEPLKCETRAVDYTNAERQLAADGGSVDKHAMALRFRIAYVVARRCYPGHPHLGAYGTFIDLLDDIEEDPDGLDDDGGINALDPTPAAGTGG